MNPQAAPVPPQAAPMGVLEQPGKCVPGISIKTGVNKRGELIKLSNNGGKLLVRLIRISS